MIVDSHVLLWWLEDESRLSPEAKESFRDAENGITSLILSSVTFWEFRLKELRGKLETSTPIRRWPGILAQLPWITVVDVDTDLWLEMAELDWAHRDPADRLIAVTALRQGVPVLTKDHQFHRSDSPVEAVW